MNVIKDTVKVELSVKKSELMLDKLVSVQLISEKLKQKEVEDNLGYKALRYRFYNSLHADKINTETISGIQFVDAKNPMKAKASIELSLRRNSMLVLNKMYKAFMYFLSYLMVLIVSFWLGLVCTGWILGLVMCFSVLSTTVYSFICNNFVTIYIFASGVVALIIAIFIELDVIKLKKK